jgi:hypothetical protein
MSDTEQKPKRVMTEEQKAKMKAGREAAKAKREEAKANGGAGAEPEPPAPKSDSETSTTSKRKGKPLTEEQKAKMKAGRDAAKAKRDADKEAGIVTPKKEKKEPKASAAPKKADKPKAAEPTTVSATRVNFMLKNAEWTEGDDSEGQWNERLFYFATNEAIHKFITQQFEDPNITFQTIMSDLDDAKISHATFIKTVADAPVYEHLAFGPTINIVKTTIDIIA